VTTDAQGRLSNPGFLLHFSGSVSGIATTADAEAMPTALPKGTLGRGAGLAACGPQPTSVRRFGGAYFVATRIGFGRNDVILRVVVPNYTGADKYSAVSHSSKFPPTAIEIGSQGQQLLTAQSGTILIADPNDGFVTATFNNGPERIELSGVWHCT